ncbi:hypothetical protein HNQ07_004677 [Deinococcus metalli]|uniref:Lipoprotein n=1 Tax=Deinococcus metalli TaxID=1141878 RepID=A0A7W8NUB8_9DEIO|nr:hypothetical protein [Deinococcus metalli]MBB5379162.1 hypothetical protein [Deinococcus metalli]GHF64606.1 hypothetical protein GCM10017781_45580 [Deinococcus metalli]
MKGNAVAVAFVAIAATACGRTDLAVQPAPSALSALGVNNVQISGTGAFVAIGSTCPLFPGFEDYPPLLLSGSLQGCWYTDIDSIKTTPSGVYLETGREVFVGTLNGGPSGTFTTGYRFEGKFAPDGTELHGRCEHPIVAGSGTGGFAVATGRVDFKDIVTDPANIYYVYRGHISLGLPGGSLAPTGTTASAGTTGTELQPLVKC